MVFWLQEGDAHRAFGLAVTLRKYAAKARLGAFHQRRRDGGRTIGDTAERQLGGVDIPSF